VFRGVLTVRAKKMTDEMFLAAAHAIAKYSEETGIHEERIIGSMTERELYVKEAIAVAEKAMELGYARRKLSRDELEHEVRSLIERSSKYMDVALKAGLIATHPPV
jgi:malate dehydrogenase (oxaloacetate-decarboxylating)